MEATRFYLAGTDEEYAVAAPLFREYALSIGINLDFQHFDEELKGLKTMYKKPHGGVILAEVQGEVVGCVAVRKITNEIGELKRMYTKPAHQHKGIGKSLLGHALELARECNYSIIKLDTLGHLVAAISLYKRAGFYETPPYYDNPVADALYFEKIL